MRSYLDFEKPVAELEQKIEELRAMQASGDVSVADEIERLEAKADADARPNSTATSRPGRRRRSRASRRGRIASTTWRS